MKARKIIPPQAELCRESRPEDGLSPLEWKRYKALHNPKSKPNHRTLQYAKAASRAIELAWATESCAEPFTEVSFQSAALGSGGAVLHVTLAVAEATEAKLNDLRPLAQAMAGRLRSAVADAVQRSRTPEIHVHLVPEEWAPDAGE